MTEKHKDKWKGDEKAEAEMTIHCIPHPKGGTKARFTIMMNPGG